MVVGVEPLAQLQPPLLRRVRAAAREGEVAGEGAAGEVVEAVVFLCVLALVVWLGVWNDCGHARTAWGRSRGTPPS